MKHLALIFFFLLTCHNVLAQVNSADSKPQKTIIVYGSDTCHYCTDTKAFLEGKKVKYVVYDVCVNLEKKTRNGGWSNPFNPLPLKRPLWA